MSYSAFMDPLHSRVHPDSYRVYVVTRQHAAHLGQELDRGLVRVVLCKHRQQMLDVQARTLPPASMTKRQLHEVLR